MQQHQLGIGFMNEFVEVEKKWEEGRCLQNGKSIEAALECDERREAALEWDKSREAADKRRNGKREAA
jgi:hypothetical protein